MTIAPNLSNITSTIPELSYRVAMSQPQSHLFEVTLLIRGWQQPQLDLKMPVWTPGSYLIREYSRQVQDFQASDLELRQHLPYQKVSKNHWQIQTDSISDVRISYRVFANELSVRTNHLDATHGYFNGAALFFSIPGYEQTPIQIEIVPPHPDWQVATTLKPTHQAHTFIADDFDTLVDSPFEIGHHELYTFDVAGKPHQFAIWGEGNLNPQQMITDTKKIIEAEAELFGDLPYQHYLFILHLSASGFGGLEHKNSCSLNYPRFNFRAKDKYNRFMQLVAHEFLHLWNVKRIRPKALEKFDYEQENYTTCLWFAEGTTSYYDVLIPLRAGIYDQKTCLDNLSKDITRFLNTPGRKVQSVTESSFDAWIKLYRRDNNSDNCQISYYLKGELISLLLDLLIRSRHQNARSLDDVMREMWYHFGKDEVGYTSEQLKITLESVANIDLTDFYRRYLDGTEEIPFNQYLEPFGLELKTITEEEPIPYLGLRVNTENGKQLIQFVETDSPASIAGLDAGDELLAIDGFRITAEQLNERLKDYQPNDRVKITVFHQEQLENYTVQLAPSQPTNYQVIKMKQLSPTQQQNLRGWLG